MGEKQFIVCVTHHFGMRDAYILDAFAMRHAYHFYAEKSQTGNFSRRNVKKCINNASRIQK